jgi:hypothetical protein
LSWAELEDENLSMYYIGHMGTMLPGRRKIT